MTLHSIFFATLLTVSFLASTVQASDNRVLYSDRGIEGALENVKHFDWAAEEKKRILDTAEYWVNLSDEEVWNFLSEQQIPRAAMSSKPARCPTHGSLESHGHYAWKVSSEHRWKVQCPIGGEHWPTNDFEAYYRSGKDANNIFREKRANRALLKSSKTGVDDGGGFHKGGDRMDFVAYYAFWGIWHRVARAEHSNAVTVLSQAYLLTGDAEYARKAGIFIARAADLYPDMNIGPWKNKNFITNDGSTGNGTVIGDMWDGEIASNLMLAYDAIRPVIDNDSDLHNFLGEMSARYKLTPQGSGADLRTHIEDNLLRVVIDAVKSRQIVSNEGRAQLTIAQAGALLGGGDLEDVLAWLEEPGDRFNGGGHLPQLFWEEVDRDGAGHEGSPYYNSTWLEAFMPLGEVLMQAGQDDLFTTYPHLRKMITYPGRLMNLGKYYPSIGNSGGTGAPEAPLPDMVGRYVEAYVKFGIKEAAVLAYILNGNSTEGMKGGLFDGDFRKVQRQIQDLVDEHGPVWEKSDNMNAYGLAMHRAGHGKDARTMWVYSGMTGRGGNHPHSDRLNLGLFGYGLDLLPDLGYPEYPTPWENSQGWVKNTISHNTVVVDAQRQATSDSGDQRIFADTPRVQFSEVDGRDVYPQTSLYRRSVAMIQIDDEHSYLVDLFRVHGGDDHVYSFHAAGAEATAHGLDLASQPGTFAGRNVKFGEFYDAEFESRYNGSGFQFLDQVEHDGNAGETFSVDWKIDDTYDQLPKELRDKVRLRMTMHGNQGDVSLANGYPALNNETNPRSLRYMLVQNQGSNLESRFLGVIDPYIGEPNVASSELMELAGEPGKDVVALKVTLASGRVDYIFSSLDDEVHATADGRFTFRGAYGVYAEHKGNPKFSFLADGGELTVDGSVVASGQTVEGTVDTVDYDRASGETRVALTGAIPQDGSFTNRWIDFKSPRDANFLVSEVNTTGESSTVVLRDTSPVTGLLNPDAPDSGFELAIAPGMDYRFPAIVYERGDAYEWMEADLMQLGTGGHDEAGLAGCNSQGTSSARGMAATLLLPLLVLLSRRARRVRALTIA